MPYLTLVKTAILTDALMYREVSRAVRSGQAARVSYLGNRALKVEPKESDP